MKLRILVLALLLTQTAENAQAAAFTFHDADGIVQELEALAAAHPALAELTTAQTLYGLPTVADGATQLSHHILRITHEASGLDKPEVLLVGGQHGDEIVGPEVCLAIARLLLESYGNDPWLTALVDRREIYIVPLANPHGHRHGVRSAPGTEGAEDMNRDHPYDRDPCDFFCDNETSLSTVGARALHELSRRHLFRVLLDYHGGIELIIHPWGTPLHNADTESPDDSAHTALGQRMSNFGGPFNGFYPVGTSTDLLGAVYGPLDDSGYATSWDPANADPLWPTQGWRALSYTVEISNQKQPPEASLGGDADLLTPGGAEDGYIPKNVRIGLAAIDIAEPYILWPHRDQIPTQVAVGEEIHMQWQVRGCFEIDETRVRYGTDPDPRTTFSEESPAQSQTSGTPCFDSPTTWNATVSFPTAGTYYLTPVARVDSSLLGQDSPAPSLPPQSWVVRSRTEDGFFFENATDPGEVNTVQGQLYWGAEALEVVVGGGIIFEDGFESGGVQRWSDAVP